MQTQTKTKIDTERLNPCGYCRRCAIHDDPGGCLEVSCYERELIASGVTPREILTVSWAGAPEGLESAIVQFEWEVTQAWWAA